MPQYTVKQGDCISSIAKQAGLLWSTVWNHPANQALKQLRLDPNVLLPGDSVFVPDISLREESRPVDQRHQFRLKEAAAQLKLQLVDRKQKPRANLSYSLSVDGVLTTGSTDAQGFLTAPIQPNAVEALLIVHDPDKTETYRLPLGSVDPVTEDSGVGQRLANLGFLAEGRTDLAPALAAFQQNQGLPATGQLDDATRAKLKSAHGS